MSIHPHTGPVSPSAVALALTVLAWSSAGAQENVVQLDRVVVKAGVALKQTLGASTITRDELEKSPPAGDVADIIRTMPGVNLTGNSSSGQRGNQRQIDIRGMGPENTLILIDGKPVASRNAVRFGWRGERDSRGDANWVPPEIIDRIEVLRGPAAARYGNGAAGGVVNIVTTPPSDRLHGSLSAYTSIPAHGDEGATTRSTFSLSGPLTDRLGFRVYGSAANFQGDATDINKDHASQRGGGNAGTFPAGREGRKTRELSGLLSWRPVAGHKIDFEANIGRDGNIYVGDTQNTNTNAMVTRALGSETNRMYRQSYALTHTGEWSPDTHSLSYVQYEGTRNARLLEGLAGGTEGAFNDPDNPNVRDGGFGDIDLRSWTVHSEFDHRFSWSGVDQMATVGVEWMRQTLNDGASDLSARNLAGGKMPAVPFAYQRRAQASVYSLFAENNMMLGDHWIVTPGLRFDHHSIHGNNWSPSLNASYLVNDAWTIKAGIARAFKAPNLYQSNDGYVLYSAGNGCWGNTGAGAEPGCFLLGNADLKAETSLNKELGFAYRDGDGRALSLTYFHNDYRNKVEAGRTPVADFIDSNGNLAEVFQWTNVRRAVVQGLEGNVTWPIADGWLWSTNLTYMIESRNKETGEHLSTIPAYTVNSTLDWQLNPQWSWRARLTWYGKQQGPKYDYYGQRLTGSATDEIAPYALVGLSTQYRFGKHLTLTAGVDNLFDKRIFRRGNAIGVNLGTPNYIYGAGAYTYNQPGRLFYLQLASAF